VTTGVALFEYDDTSVTYLDHWQIKDANNFYLWLHDLAHEQQDLGHDVTLVVEQFDKRPGVINPDLTPKYINRDIENHIHDVPIVKQIPALAMNLVPPAHKGVPDGLKRFGWYLVSNVHANDAARHVASYLAYTLKHLPTILLGWPKPKGN
jgi:hypothetical protein